jgi:GntR family transcriptional repressor for pyruvate dehydrogenase complex
MNSKEPQKSFVPIQSERTSKLVENQIKQAIFESHFAPGDKMPSERELAEIFAVSRGAVQEALHSLEKSGLIIIKKGVKGGSYVAQADTNLVVNSLKDLFQLKQVSLEDIRQVRLVIEPPLCAIAAEKATQNDIERLEEWNKKLHSAFCAGNPVLEHDPRIHTLIAEISGNPLFIIILKALMEVHAHRMLSIPLSDEVKRDIIHHHETIIDALKNRDKEAAYECMKEHVCQVQEDLSNLEKRRVS